VVVRARREPRRLVGVALRIVDVALLIAERSPEMQARRDELRLVLRCGGERMIELALRDFGTPCGDGGATPLHAELPDDVRTRTVLEHPRGTFRDAERLAQEALRVQHRDERRCDALDRVHVARCDAALERVQHIGQLGAKLAIGSGLVGAAGSIVGRQQHIAIEGEIASRRDQRLRAHVGETRPRELPHQLVQAVASLRIASHQRLVR
jgi:hypothetical protein